MRTPAPIRSRQRGVAVVTALLLTTLAVTIVASLFWQQQVQVRSIENQRLQLQKEWILRGALDWASLILRTHNQQSNIDHLREAWAAPLAETRLDQYMEEGQASNDAGDAILSGNIVDAQSRYNLSNLSTQGVQNPLEVAAFKRLLINLRLPPTLAKTVADAVAAAQPSKTGPGNGQLTMLQAEDLLALPGVTPAMVRQLKDFVVVLPVATPVNVNTAPAEVLAARFESLTMAEAATLVGSRWTAPFQDSANLAARMTQLFNKSFPEASDQNKVSLSTKYFLVNGKIRMGRAALDSVSLINRDERRTTVIWIREQ
ncbi:type II secretion system minor pseudopilin GspK [Paraherbaspirillum soli]|uniref:Type II secretion system protein K n=1 Tax=Paraherbaspirillum soli TaxID=631222 RepID=A0ABW0M5Y2_9BURK